MHVSMSAALSALSVAIDGDDIVMDSALASSIISSRRL